MENKDAKELVDNIFKKVETAGSLLDLKMIRDSEISPNLMDEVKYPRLEFEITANDIKVLQNNDILDSEFELNHHEIGKIKDPLAKLLYALIWKNGDLKKLKHIINGINKANEEEKESEQEDALVFYQFGKHLAKKSTEPIIDQHVLRAFALHKATDEREFEKIRKIGVINRQHKHLIYEYKEWLQNLVKLKGIEDYMFHVDKVLFALGKTIKLK